MTGRRRSPPQRQRISPAHRLELVGELASLINQTFDLRQIFRTAIVKLRDVLPFRRASVALVNDDRRAYYLHTLYDAARDGFAEGTTSFAIAAGATGKAIASGRPLRLDGFQGTDGIRLKGERKISVLIIPLRVSGEVIGALNLGAAAGAPYTDADLELAAVLGRQIETSLHYSKLFATIEQQRERLAAEHAAVDAERSRLAALVDASDAAVMMVSEDRVVHVNQAFAWLTGRPRDILAGSSLSHVHEALERVLADATTLAPQVAALERHEPLRDRVEFSFPQPRICQRTVAPVLGAGGEALGYVVIYRDVTQEAQSAAAKDEFVAVVSHELRTPLTSINTSLELLSRGAAASPEDAKDLIDLARRNLTRLIRLVEDLLDLSRIGAGRIVTERKPVPATDATARAQEAVRAFAEARRVALRTEFRTYPIIVLGDLDRLEQVFVNLLANAIKFSPEGGEVLLSGWVERDAAYFEVADQGPGIPTDKLETIFDRFHQLESAVTRNHGGAGLGLTISRGIVEHIGGRIWAESRPGGGARFRVELPLAPRPALAALPEHGTVLLADRDAERSASVAGSFREHGWTTIVHQDGGAALEDAGAKIDLVVVSTELRDMHGLDFLQRLRATPHGVDLPTLLVGTQRRQAQLVGADGSVEQAGAALLDEAVRVLAAPRRPVLLLIEDDPELRVALRRALFVAGYGCLEAANGDAGLEMVGRRVPDLVITDLQLPQRHGLAVVEELRRDPALAALPVVVITAYADAAARLRLRALDARILDKPFEPGDLLQLLAEVIPPRAVS